MNVINPRPQFNPPFSSNNFNKIIWADLPMNLEISPLTGDLTKIINQNAIEASMTNIIETFQYEPRVVLKNVVVNVNADADSYQLFIYYSLANNPSVILIFNQILQRTSD